MQLYHRYVQRLYDYGMQVCRDRLRVLEALRRLFVRVANGDLTVKEHRSAGIFLFREFRTILAHEVGSVASPKEARRMKLSLSQHEAIFLKFHGRFSYREIASIMQIDVALASSLVSEGIESLYHEWRKPENVEA